MSRFIKVVSLLIIIAAVFSACGTAEPEMIPEYEFEVAEGDLGGFRAVFGWSAEEGESVLGFVTDTANADYAAKRKKEVEDALNCVIDIYYNTEIIGMLRAGVMSGSQPFDIMEGDGYHLVSDVRAGYLTGLKELLDIENTDKWGTPNMLQSMLWNDDVYGVVPFAWPELVYRIPGHLLAVNENIITALGQTDPREFVETNSWTWDLFEEKLEEYTFDDAGTTIYALRCHPAYFSINFFLSSGVALSAYENGQVVCGLYTDIGREAMQRAQDIYQVTHKHCFHPQTDSTGHDEFIRGEAAMYLTWTYELTTDTKYIMYNMDNVGVIPFPQGPHATPGKYLSYHEGLGFATGIPANAKDPEASAAILSQLYEPFEEYKTKDDIIDYMTYQVFHDRRDFEVIENSVRNTEYGFFKEGARKALENVLGTHDSIPQILDSLESVYDKIVDDYMVYHYEARIEVYGE
jgi:ABC-type glycerol-3-phosphate transport system substrate-binding protein